MKTYAAIRNSIGILTLIGVLNTYGDCFNYSSGPTSGSPVTSEIAVVSSCSIGSCPYVGASPGSCTVSATVSGQTMTKYTAGGSFSAGDFGLSAGWETQTINGSSGTATKTWSNWCEAHNADTAQTTVTSTILHWTTCNGTVTSSSTESLTTVTAFFARAPAVPDAAQPSPCSTTCPQG
jgi:hypothetical protein